MRPGVKCVPWRSAVLLCVLLASATATEETDLRTVAVREAILRDRPSFLGRIVKRLPYEEAVVVEEKKAKSTWVKVRHKGATRGWMKESALHEGPVGLRKGGAAPDARAGETTRSLAGRGFNEKVERARRDDLRAQGSDIEKGYRKLDGMLARKGVFTIDPADVGPFVRDGDLGGGQK